MKKLKFLSFLMAALTLVVACSDKDDDKNANPLISVEYNGTKWETTTVVASYTSVTDGTMINATKISSQDQLVISFTGTTTGTQIFADPGEGALFSISLAGLGSYTTLFTGGNVGELVITKYDNEKKLISGTFHCTAENFEGDVIEFTNGQFSNIPVMN
ncbi:MAG TPA: DUF6252 family protein [Lentimicrobium sp.]|nr:DUF6252 family protein [Lentimicrobium sp.]